MRSAVHSIRCQSSLELFAYIQDSQNFRCRSVLYARCRIQMEHSRVLVLWCQFVVCELCLRKIANRFAWRSLSVPLAWWWRCGRYTSVHLNTKHTHNRNVVHLCRTHDSTDARSNLMGSTQYGSIATADRINALSMMSSYVVRLFSVSDVKSTPMI